MSSSSSLVLSKPQKNYCELDDVVWGTPNPLELLIMCETIEAKNSIKEFSHLDILYDSHSPFRSCSDPLSCFHSVKWPFSTSFTFIYHTLKIVYWSPTATTAKSHKSQHRRSSKIALTLRSLVNSKLPYFSSVAASRVLWWVFQLASWSFHCLKWLIGNVESGWWESHTDFIHTQKDCSQVFVLIQMIIMHSVFFQTR